MSEGTAVTIPSNGSSTFATTSGFAEVWDPFDGTRSVSLTKVSRLDIAGLGRTARWVGIGALALLACYVFVSEHFGKPFLAAAFMWVVLVGAKPVWKRSTELAHAAAAKGWIYGGEIGKSRMKVMVRKLPELFHARVGMSSLSLREEVYGHTPDGAAFWLGTNSSGANNDPNRVAGSYALLVAFQLDRDSGVKATILPERMTTAQAARPDFQTESVEFNNAFEVKLKSPGEQDRLALLRALTPATQTSLLDLSARYQVRLVIEGETIFVGGFGELEDGDAQAFGDSLANIIAEFAGAAAAVKTYVE